MQHDLTKLAASVFLAHELGRPIRLPAMTARELGVLTRLLTHLETTARTATGLIH